ncbi:uncharacterized protein BDR25DRAFT_292068 [Lindgomyces ingoldianus]|uniref:Uncharacterized protein n=1 Tax=Lindgomyces ingoldianus TaxID=673940 RepID=A0ACB6QLW6_9PLEO|nr:uncharacterized protein BDR25DRAFT_292068 [Lindgomyces ingoldianus]KAF2467573.1 hypothetical protein BDR25DRAFT_292068 [Lindgomyces ingoldianus]
MICQNCIRAAARTHRISGTVQFPRFLTTTTTLQSVTPISTTTKQGSPASSHTPLSATSTPVLPFNASLTPAPKKAGLEHGHGHSKGHHTVMSSIPAGTPLKGLNFLKNKTDPVAMEDAEYPSWLWDILKEREKQAETGGAGDLFSKSKKQRRLAAKRLRKEQLANPDLLVPKIPIYEQTVDLPSGDGTLQGAVQAAKAREELTKAMRVKRRGAIKESNFLKAMR